MLLSLHHSKRLGRQLLDRSCNKPHLIWPDGFIKVGIAILWLFKPNFCLILEAAEGVEEFLAEADGVAGGDEDHAVECVGNDYNRLIS